MSDPRKPFGYVDTGQSFGDSDLQRRMDTERSYMAWRSSLAFRSPITIEGVQQLVDMEIIPRGYGKATEHDHERLRAALLKIEYE